MNDQQRAAMQMALTTLEELKKNCTIWLESDDAAITALREALAQPPKVNEYGEELCEDEGCPHHGTPHICVSDPSVLADHSGGANEMVAEPVIPEWVDVDDYEEPVKQEPVGYQYLFSSPFGGDVWRDSSNQWNGNKPKASRAIYAAPVRTKDLTLDEFADIGSELAAKNCVSDIAFARAVIAADREKNK